MSLWYSTARWFSFHNDAHYKFNVQQSHLCTTEVSFSVALLVLLLYNFVFTCCSVDDGFPPVTLHFQNSLTLMVYPHEYLFPFVSKLCCTNLTLLSRYLPAIGLITFFHFASRFNGYGALAWVNTLIALDSFYFVRCLVLFCEIFAFVYIFVLCNFIFFEREVPIYF